MKTQDVIDPDFKQKPVMLIKEESKLQVMGNPVYYPIFMSLRDGYKTVKEIEQDYTKYTKKEAKKKGAKTKKEIEEFVKKNKRSGKSLYRYIQHLVEADFVVPVGKRVALEKPMTEKLFARTAKFFFVDSYSDKMLYTDKGPDIEYLVIKSRYWPVNLAASFKEIKRARGPCFASKSFRCLSLSCSDCPPW